MNINDIDFPSEKLLPLNLHGGFSEYNRESLLEIFNTKEVKTAIEIGSWIDLSSSFIAQRVEKLYCIDPWELQPEQDIDNWRDFGSSLYNQFLSNMIHLGLGHKVFPIKSFSKDAEVAEKVDLIFIDGSHKYEEVKFDILKWNNYLKDGGIICGDDLGIPISNISEGVVRAVNECSEKLNKKLTTNQTFWKLE